jgi:hypothetical protein
VSPTPKYSKLYPLDGESPVKGYKWGVKILDYEGLNERLDRQMELRSLDEAEKHMQRFKDGDKPHRGTPRYEIINCETDDYPSQVWKVLKRYWIGSAPYYESAEATAYFWGIISNYTEPFYVYCSPKEHTIPDISDLDNELSESHDDNFVYRIECRDGEVTIYKRKAEIVGETVAVEGFDVDEDDVDEW